jgi:CheY-like chemotaxis protein
LLLVEDNAINREIASTLLRRAGIAVSIAGDGREALDMLERQRFDGVLMDCQMPIMDGYAATRMLRKQPQWKDLPVIAMTANALVGDRDKVLAAGMNDHIAKPIKVENLFATLARWIHVTETDAISGIAGDEPLVDAVEVFNGIDRRAGIAATMGDEVLYLNLLRMFRDREADFAHRFRMARIRGDADGATRMAHDLKSVTGSLGVSAVQRAATGLELACENGTDDAGIERLLEDVARLLAPVIAGLRTLEPATPR